MTRYFLKFSYIGSLYRGAQKHSRPNIVQDIDSIQGAIETGIRTIRPKCINEPSLVLSSRTDAGVHALAATAHVDLEHPFNTIYGAELALKAMNRYFVKCHDIRLLQWVPVTNDFHVRKCAKSRTYLYRFLIAKKYGEHRVPIGERNHSLHFRAENFDIEKVKRATRLFMGTKDFTTFSARSRTNVKINYVRELQSLTVEKAAPLMPFDPLSENFDYWHIVCSSRAFLYNQVRRIVSALLGIGSGIITEKDLVVMLQVPSHYNWLPRLQLVEPSGLYLVNVEYDEEEFKKYILSTNDNEQSNEQDTTNILKEAMSL